MTIGAKHTRAALKRHVLPVLRDAGFTDGTPSRLWRHRDGEIAIICLSTYSTYRALTDHCTTASFSVSIGRSMKTYSVLNSHFHRDHIKEGPNGPRPDEPHMPIRGYLCPSDARPLTRGRWGRLFESIWHVNTVDDAERNATELASQLEDYALDWLTREWDVANILERLDSDEVDPILVAAENGSHLWLDAGAKGSQVRADHLMMARHGSGKRRLPG